MSDIWTPDSNIWTPSHGPSDGLERPGNIISFEEEMRRRELLIRQGAILEKRIRAARNHPLSLYQLCFCDDEGGPVTITWFHKEWCDAVLRYPEAQIEAPRGTAKCRTGNQRVLLANGAYVPIRVLAEQGEAVIVSYDERSRALVNQIAFVKPNGKAPVERLELEDGAVHELTSNEPILTDAGWKRADAVTSADYIRCVRKDFTTKSNRSLPRGIGWLLGLLNGDGTLASGTRLSCADEGVLRRYDELGLEMCFSRSKVAGDNVDWYTQGLTSIIDPYGIRHKTSRSKSTPRRLYKVSSRPICEYLAGYWDADGTGEEDTAVLSYTSVSEDLIDGVKHLALRTPRPAVGSKTNYVNEKGRVWRVTFYGRDALNLWSQIYKHTGSDKAQRLNAAWLKRFGDTPWLKSRVGHWRYLQKMATGDGFSEEGQKVSQRSYCVPARAVLKVLDEHGLTESAVLGVWNTPEGDAPAIGFSGQQDRYREATVLRLARVCELLGAPVGADKLRDLADSRYHWCKVEDTRHLGAQETYALCSPVHQTYICEGAITHNTTFMICMVLWMMGKNPNIRIALICGSDVHAAKRLQEIRSHVEKDALYQAVFPGVKIDKHSENNSLTMNLVRGRHTKDPTVQARGVLADGVGTRNDLIVLDDICNFKNSVLEPATKPKVLQKLRGDWLPTKAPRSGRVWSIFTPWVQDDANAVLKREMRGRWWYKRYFHGSPEDPYHSIFPELFSREYLMKERVALGVHEFARAYWCQARNPDLVMVRPEHIRPYAKSDFGGDVLDRCIALLSIDPTGGDRKNRSAKNDDPDFYGYSIQLYDLGLLNEMQHRMPRPGRPFTPYRVYNVDTYQMRVSTRQAVAHAIALHRRWNFHEIVVEAQGQQTLHEWFWSWAPSLSVIGMPTGNLDKQQRLEATTPLLDDPRQVILFHPDVADKESGSKEFPIVIQSPEAETIAARRTLREQLLNFPLNHDDALDAYVQGVRYGKHKYLAINDEHLGAGTPNVNPRTAQVNVGVTHIGL